MGKKNKKKNKKKGGNGTPTLQRKGENGTPSGTPTGTPTLEKKVMPKTAVPSSTLASTDDAPVSTDDAPVAAAADDKEPEAEPSATKEPEPEPLATKVDESVDPAAAKGDVTSGDTAPTKTLQRKVSEEKLASLEGETSAIRKEISDFNSRVKTAKRRVTDMEGKGSGAEGDAKRAKEYKDREAKKEANALKVIQAESVVLERHVSNVNDTVGELTTDLAANAKAAEAAAAKAAELEANAKAAEAAAAKVVDPAPEPAAAMVTGGAEPLGQEPEPLKTSPNAANNDAFDYVLPPPSPGRSVTGGAHATGHAPLDGSATMAVDSLPAAPVTLKAPPVETPPSTPSKARAPQTPSGQATSSATAATPLITSKKEVSGDSAGCCVVM